MRAARGVPAGLAWRDLAQSGRIKQVQQDLAVPVCSAGIAGA
jgi:hypothetical protein